MRDERFKVVLFDDAGGVREERRFKSYREICDEYGLQYHVVRQLHRYSTSMERKKPRELMQYLQRRMRIERVPFEFTEKLR